MKCNARHANEAISSVMNQDQVKGSDFSPRNINEQVLNSAAILSFHVHHVNYVQEPQYIYTYSFPLRVAITGFCRQI